jgi:hypothetical protein
MQIVSRQVDSAFGRWTQTECRPRHLAGVVDQICHFSGTVAHAHERVFPNGVVELIVHLDHRYRLITNDLGEMCPETCVGGLQTRALVVEAPAAACTVLGIRLCPAAAFAVLGLPLSELTDLTVDLTDVAGPAARDLVNRCRDAATVEACLHLVAGWVESRLAQNGRILRRAKRKDSGSGSRSFPRRRCSAGTTRSCRSAERFSSPQSAQAPNSQGAPNRAGPSGSQAGRESGRFGA